jgi:hypothetical protein
VESLNFLCLLPYLKDGAIVVIHDVVMGVNNIVSSGFLAPRILMSVLAAEKLSLKKDSEQDFNSNIIAVQVSSDTRKYIRNVFDALLLPWGKMPKEADLKNIRKLLEKHYPPRQVLIYDKAVQNNKNLYVSDTIGFTPAEFRKCNFLNMLKAGDTNPVTFYGAGFLMMCFMNAVSASDFQINARIWDMNAESIGEIHGIKVLPPDFQTKVRGQMAIIMIGDCGAAGDIRMKLESLGYVVFHGIKEYLLYGGSYNVQ